MYLDQHIRQAASLGLRSVFLFLCVLVLLCMTRDDVQKLDLIWSCLRRVRVVRVTPRGFGESWEWDCHVHDNTGQRRGVLEISRNWPKILLLLLLFIVSIYHDQYRLVSCLCSKLFMKHCAESWKQCRVTCSLLPCLFGVRRLVVYVVFVNPLPSAWVWVLFQCVSCPYKTNNQTTHNNQMLLFPAWWKRTDMAFPTWPLSFSTWYSPVGSMPSRTNPRTIDRVKPDCMSALSINFRSSPWISPQMACSLWLRTRRTLSHALSWAIPSSRCCRPCSGITSATGHHTTHTHKEKEERDFLEGIQAPQKEKESEREKEKIEKRVVHHLSASSIPYPSV